MNGGVRDCARNLTRETLLCRELWVADTFFTRLRGLLATPPAVFASGCGLWITPSQGVHMLGMQFAIDAIYLDGDLRVVHLEPELRPWRLGAIRRTARSVLELPAGTLHRTRTRLGDQIAIDYGSRDAFISRTNRVQDGRG